ncbi:Nudix hydrolase 2 [Hordeum vulgare]|nr:Nudix hydrolase 2 [Hordeum vulgare]
MKADADDDPDAARLPEFALADALSPCPYVASPCPVVASPCPAVAVTAPLHRRRRRAPAGPVVAVPVPRRAPAPVHDEASRRFWIEDNAFWKDGAPFQIVGGDVHYFRIVPQEGFWYHHAEETYLMLAYWLPNTPHTLPINATHRVGVGAFVMNDKREVLVVQEKNDVLKGLGIWKFPTGVVEPGEDINIGVVREVKEEAGVCMYYIAYRQSHKAYFEKPDLFFVCILRPLSVDITKQESEIEDAQWMPVEEFAAQPFVQKHELVKYILEVSLAKVDKEYAGFSPISIKSAF